MHHVIRSTKAIWRCSGIFIPQNSWVDGRSIEATSNVIHGKRCRLWGMLLELIWALEFIWLILHHILDAFLFVADIWHTYKNDWDIGKDWFFYTRVYFKPNAIRCPIFQTAVLLSGSIHPSLPFLFVLTQLLFYC